MSQKLGFYDVGAVIGSFPLWLDAALLSVFCSLCAMNYQIIDGDGDYKSYSIVHADLKELGGSQF
jgi:hypothetical protein